MAEPDDIEYITRDDVKDKTIVLVRLEWRKVSDWRISQGVSRCKAKGGKVGSTR